VTPAKAWAFFLVLLAAAGIGIDEAQARKAPARPRLVVLAKPATATAGDSIAIPGRVRGQPMVGNLRVELQVRDRVRMVRPRGRRGGTRQAIFVTQARARVDRKRRFSIRYAVPAGHDYVFVRLRLMRGKEVLGQTSVWKLVVREAVPAVGPVQERKTLVLDAASVLEVPPAGEAGQLRFAGFLDLNPGDVIVTGVGPATPYGFLGKVVSVTHDGSSTTVQTVPATLPEAVPEGSWSGQVDLEPVGSEAASASANSSRATASSPVYVNKVVKCGLDQELSVDGRIHVDSWIETSASWGFGSGVRARFVGHMDADGELSLTAEAGASCGTGTRLLFLVPLRVIVFSVGPIPVVLIPAISATLSGGGGLSGNVSVGATGTAQLHAGVDYYDGQAHPVGGITPKFTGGSAPTVEGSGHIGGTISPAINLLVYGVGGPKAALNVGLSLDATASEDPPWTLTSPVSVTAGLSIPRLGIGSSEFTIWDASYLLGHG
jgi:hypothetical protein